MKELIERIGERHTKKELVQMGTTSAEMLLADGWDSPVERFVYVKKAIVYLTAYNQRLDSTVREKIGKEDTVHGAKLSIGSTGDRIDYASDPIYAELTEKLQRRTELLKAAYNGAEVYDEDGVLIPKLGLKSASKEILKVAL